MSRKLRSLLLVSLLGIALAAPLRAGDPPRSVWVKAKCAVCHGADGHGDTPNGKKLGLRDLAAPEIQKRTDAELAKLVREGHQKMPGFKKALTDQQVSSLVLFMRSVGKH